MDFSKLSQFCLVVESGTIAKASQLLKISPSALSRSIQRMESEVEIDLLTPIGRNICPTDDGMKFYEVAKSTLRNFHESLGKIRASKPETTEFRIGSFEVFTTYVLQDLLEKELSGSRVTALELTPGAIELALLESRVDVGFTYAPVPLPGIIVDSVAKFRMGTYARRDAKFLKDGKESVPFAVPVTAIPRSGTDLKSLDAWPPNAFKRQVHFQFELLETALMAARSGTSAIHCPEFIAALSNSSRDSQGTNLIPFPSATPRPAVVLEVYMLRRSGTPEDRSLKKIAAGLRRICAMRVPIEQ